ncbi:glutamate--cysteine ligase [Actinomadura meridiana]|uniref:Glutamate--cysteine ligase n=1 Tax=Actinomadura meridiana TaxID=559626 RepID=A0ABP8CLS8_9ACTN
MGATITGRRLRSAFAPGRRELVGLEVESAVLDLATGRAAPYEGPRGVKAILEIALAETGGRPLCEGPHLTGVELPDGACLSLEHGGQLEYSSNPVASVGEAVDRLRLAMRDLAGVLDRFGLGLVPGGFVPFDGVDTISWVPIGRGDVMRSYFTGLGEAGSDGPKILGLSTSTQVHLDFVSEADFTRKLRMLAVASPVVAALFVNSPLAGRRLDGVLSHRSLAWLRTDPARCGVLRPALRPDVSLDDLVEWALTLPMVYRVDEAGRFRCVPDRPFGSLIRDGFDDGTAPTLDDWNYHLSQIWTHIRVRHTLELRAADGPPHPYVPAFVALWVGLTYHAPSREAAWQLLGGRPPEDYETATAELPHKGLRTMLGDDRVSDLAAELVRLARQGLQARVDDGVEPPDVPGHLDPLDEILATGETFAERCAHRWQHEFRCDPMRYVDAYRVPTE